MDWNKNKRNFEKNVSRIFPAKVGKWKIYLVCGDFLGKNLKPYDEDSFSACNLIAASKEQGWEIMIFLNKSRLGFLSEKALMHIARHELFHIRQIGRNSREYLISILEDKLSRKLEKEADSNSKEDERRAYVLESVLYCYETWGWQEAGKMAEFLFSSDSRYGGGYDKDLKPKEYKAFLEARKKRDISIFVEIFG